MTELSDVFVRDVTEVLSFPGGVRERLISGPWGQSVSYGERSISDILDEKLAPLRIIYTPEYTNMVAHPVSCITKGSEIKSPNLEPVPMRREFAEPVRESKSDEDVPIVTDAPRLALPWSSNGKLVGQRHYGDYCINPLKKPDVTIVSPDEPDTEPPAAGSCVVL